MNECGVLYLYASSSFAYVRLCPQATLMANIKATWWFQNEHLCWNKYENVTQGVLEAAFQSYRKWRK